MIIFLKGFYGFKISKGSREEKLEKPISMDLRCLHGSREGKLGKPNILLITEDITCPFIIIFPLSNLKYLAEQSEQKMSYH